MKKALACSIVTVFLVFAAACSLVSADAQVPQTVNYQGKLRQANGLPVADGTYTIKFTIYDAQSAGNSVWTETYTNINVTGGLFYVLLGDTVGNPIGASVFPAGANRWLGIKVGTDNEMTPRQKLASAPYAIRSDTVSPASIGSAELKSEAGSLSNVSGGALTVSGGNVSVTGTISGNGSGLTNLSGSSIGTGINGANFTDGTVTAAKLASGVVIAPGAIVPCAGTSAPTGWFLCDGSGKSTTTYAALFAVIGYTYGGSGSTFNLPDMRQRFPLGKAASGTGSTMGATGGAIDHTHTGPSHTHDYSDVISHTHAIDPPSTTSADNSVGHTHTWSSLSTGSNSAGHTHTFSDTSSSNGGHSHTVTIQCSQSLYGAGSSQYAGSTGSVTLTLPSKSHTHAISCTSSSSDSHTHTYSGTTTSTGAHTHTTDIAEFTSGDASDGAATGTTAAGGTGATGTNNPPYQVVNYVIKW